MDARTVHKADQLIFILKIRQRIFNPLSQSEKIDPNGDYVRYWVPELRSLKGKSKLCPSLNLLPHIPSGSEKTDGAADFRPRSFGL